MSIIYIYVYVCIYVHTCMRACMCACIHTYVLCTYNGVRLNQPTHTFLGPNQPACTGHSCADQDANFHGKYDDQLDFKVPYHQTQPFHHFQSRWFMALF